MDEQTRLYYATHAPEVADYYDRWPSALSAHLRLAFAPGARVLDIGAGSGRNLAALCALGYDVYGVEPSPEMREQALQRHPSLRDRLLPGQLPKLGEPFGGSFDGVLCSAVLMHLPPEHLPAAARAIRKVLVDDGALLLSVPHTRPGLDAEHRDKHGRLFTPLRVADLGALFEPLGFGLLGQWTSDDVARAGYSWITLLFLLQARSSPAITPGVAGARG